MATLNFRQAPESEPSDAEQRLERRFVRHCVLKFGGMIFGVSGSLYFVLIVSAHLFSRINLVAMVPTVVFLLVLPLSMAG